MILRKPDQLKVSRTLSAHGAANSVSLIVPCTIAVTRRGGILSRISSFISLLLSLLVYVILAVCSLKYFSFTFSDFKINSRISESPHHSTSLKNCSSFVSGTVSLSDFTRQQFDSFTYYALGTSIWIGILSLGWEIAGALMR